MNNRIMAMLFALVAAMFISIVPVKAEAAHTCVDNSKDCICDSCGTAMNHKITKYEKKDATCKEEGMEAYSHCTVCNAKWNAAGNKVQSAELKINKLAHTYGSYTYTDTQHTEVCGSCGGQLKTAVDHQKACIDDKNGTTHTWSCKTEGCEWTVAAEAHVDANNNCSCDYCDAKLEHKLGDWIKDGTGHWKACSTCGGSFEIQAGHNYGKAVSKKDGLKHTKTCKDCGYVVEESCIDSNEDCKCDTCKFAIKHDKSWARMEPQYKDPTCTETGLMSHTKCKFCGLLLNNNNEVTTLEAVTSDALGHAYQKAISCDEEYHYYRCTRTGCTEQDQKAEHELVYTSNHDGTHSGKCKVCNKAPAAAQNVKHSDGNGNCICDYCDVQLDHKLVNVLAVEPACEKEGVVAHKKCETCGKLFSKVDGRELKAEEVVRKALVHTPNGKWERDEEGHYQWCINNCATKLLKDVHTYGDWAKRSNTEHDRICEVCKYTDVAKHVYGEPEEGNGETHKIACEDCGYATRQTCSDSAADSDCMCEACGGKMAHKDMSKLTYVKAKDPTCTEDGNTDHYKCETCGGIYLSDGSEWDPFLEKLGHDWEARKDTLNGQHLQKCKRSGCGDYRTLNCDDTTGDCLCDINNCGKLIHSHKLVFHNPVAPTCEGKGAEGYFTYQDCDKKMFDMNMDEITAPVEIAATGHTASGEWTVNGEVHEELCAVCDKVLESAEHVDANYDNRCDDCDVALALELMPEKPATCTNIGYKACWVSPVTNRMYSDAEGRNHITAREVIPATGHNYSGWEDAQDGLKHGKICLNENCDGSRIVETEHGPMEYAFHTIYEHHTQKDGLCFCIVCNGNLKGHRLTMIKMVPATCAKAGTQAYFKCSCGKLYDMGYNPIEAPKTIAKLDHDYKDVKVQKDAKEGKHYVACNGCGNKVYENHTMVVNDPLKGNYHQYLCACGELEIETHYDKNGDKWCDVCGHGMGKTSVTVEQHNSQTVITGQSDKVNANKNWWWNWQEVFTPSNSGGSAATGNTEQNTTSSNGVSDNDPSNNGPVNNGNTNNNSSSNGGSNDSVVTPPAGSEGVDERAVTAPTVSQTNVLVQFINWFLGLFGF